MFLMLPAHLGSPGQRAVKWLCVYVCVSSLSVLLLLISHIECFRLVIGSRFNFCIALQYVHLQCFDAVGWVAGRASEWWGASLVICLERGADLHIAQLMPLPLALSLLQ